MHIEIWSHLLFLYILKTQLSEQNFSSAKNSFCVLQKRKKSSLISNESYVNHEKQFILLKERKLSENSINTHVAVQSTYKIRFESRDNFTQKDLPSKIQANASKFQR